MKKILILTSILLIFTSASAFSDTSRGNYGKGYQQGYQKGYQYQDQGGVEPIAPIPPIPPIPHVGESGYDDGYRRGVIEGHEERGEGEY